MKRQSALRDFLNDESLGGVLLMVASACALVIANSGLGQDYLHWLHAETGPVISPKLGPMTVHLWINDALMALFFLLVGLEIKREFVDGELSSWTQRRLPVIAALAGMIVPALIYLMVAGASGDLARGWAIPAATDIAFAVAVLALLGTRVPVALKLFLTTVAIVDDIGAVAIIALAYTDALSPAALAAALVILGAMLAMNRMGVRALWPYLIAFGLLWYAVMISGVHATVAGVLAALTIPVTRTPGAPDSIESPLHRLEHALSPWVAFLIVPLFGFANAGVTLGGDALGALGDPLPLGIMLGLFVGKQLGVFGSIWISVRLGLAARPGDASWAQIYGMAMLCGIGFTMSLFIAALAFPGHPELGEAAKLGVIAGSLLSALGGFAILRLAAPRGHAGPH